MKILLISLALVAVCAARPGNELNENTGFLTTAAPTFAEKDQAVFFQDQIQYQKDLLQSEQDKLQFFKDQTLEREVLLKNQQEQFFYDNINKLVPVVPVFAPGSVVPKSFIPQTWNSIAQPAFIPGNYLQRSILPEGSLNAIAQPIVPPQSILPVEPIVPKAVITPAVETPAVKPVITEPLVKTPVVEPVVPVELVVPKTIVPEAGVVPVTQAPVIPEPVNTPIQSRSNFFEERSDVAPVAPTFAPAVAGNSPLIYFNGVNYKALNYAYTYPYTHYYV